jgi:hypothetical protein
MAFDPSGIIIGGVMAISNLGGVALLLKWYMSRVDETAKTTNEHSVMMGKTAEIQKATADTLARLSREVGELYRDRNDHAKNLTEINTLHAMKGCKTFYQKGK